MEKRTFIKINLINLCLMCLLLLRGSYDAKAQTITRDVSPSISGTVCPGVATDYNVSIPSGFANCSRSWSVTNGTINGSTTGTSVKVFWNDTPGATATVSCTFSGCPSSSNNKTVSLNELILSVKNQSWGTYGNVINIDYCTPAQVVVTVPKMYVQGTGGISQPPLQEALYAWTLPAGWQTLSGATGAVNSSSNTLVIKPTKCSVPGMVKVEGVIIDRCGAAGLSSAAVISLNGASPVLTVGPQPGYVGSTPCNTTPVTFYATTQVALGCINSYSWNFPPSWSLVSQSGNSITLAPSGTASDSGPIKATINMSCGSSVTSGNYVPPFLSPSISGPYYICSDGDSFSLDNVQPGTPVTWSVEPAYLFSTSTSGTGTTAPLAAASEGPATITFEISAGCSTPLQYQRTFQVGPGYADFTISTYGVECANQGDLIDFVAGVSGFNYEWTVLGGDLLAGQGTGSIFVQVTSPGGMAVYCNVWTSIAEYCYGPHGSASLNVNPCFELNSINTSPNPASNTLLIDLDKPDDSKPLNIAVINQRGEQMMSLISHKSKLELNTEKLPKGLYILKISYDGGYYTKRIVIDK